MGETYLMGIAPHNPNGPVANVVALHFDLATPNFLIQEDMVGDVPWRFDVVQTSLQAEKGYWLPLDEPGWGSRSTKPKRASTPSSRKSSNRWSFTPTVPWPNGERAESGDLVIG